jgi:hypothetical protein
LFQTNLSFVPKELRRHGQLPRSDVGQTEPVSLSHCLGFDLHTKRGAEVLFFFVDMPQRESHQRVVRDVMVQSKAGVVAVIKIRLRLD